MRYAAMYLCGLTALLPSCVPDVYLIDRQTVLEVQSSGNWPELDRIFYEQAMSSGPLPIEKTADRKESRQLFQMTLSDFNQKVGSDNRKEKVSR